VGKKYRQTNGGLNPGTNATRGQTIMLYTNASTTLLHTEDRV